MRQGHDIRVVDRDTGADLTQVTLSQIVLSEEKRGPQRLVGAGTEVLHERGQALLDYVRRTLNVPGDLVTEVERRRGDLEGILDEQIERALRRLRLPSRHDIDRINERLDRLTEEVGRSRRPSGGTAPPAKARSRRKASR